MHWLTSHCPRFWIAWKAMWELMDKQEWSVFQAFDVCQREIDSYAGQGIKYHRDMHHLQHHETWAQWYFREAQE